MGYREIILADSPYGYWPLGETSGATAVAAAGSNGTYTSVTLGQAGISTSTGQTSIRVTGIGSYATVPDAGSAGKATGSIEIWLNPGTNSGDCCFIGNGPYFSIPSNGAVNFYLNGPGWQTGGGAVAAGAWRHLVATWTAAGGTIYSNGAVLYTLPANSGVFFSTAVDFGRRSDVPNSPCTGYYQHVAFYNTVLSAAQIRKHYTEGLASAGLKRFGEFA